MSNSTLTRSSFLYGAISALMLLAATTSSALSISAEFNLANSAFTNPVTVHSANWIEVNLTPGDVVALNVIVENTSLDVVTALFTSLVTDYTQMAFLGGAFSNILTESSCVGFLCSPATLAPGIPSPIIKPNDPSSLLTGTTQWVQAVAHTNVTGAAGAGPDSAVLLAYQYIGVGGSELVLIDAASTAGDASAGVTGPISFTGAMIGMPEPGTAVLFGLGLMGLRATRPRKRSPARDRPRSRDLVS